MNKVFLHNWAIVDGLNDPYMAPERRGIRIRGEVFGHDNFADGEKVTTGIVRDVNGREVYTNTSSNSYYILVGPPKQDYLDWLKEHGFEFDPDNPIKDKR